jgi:membrane fusion protein, multidrug efflux system
MYKNITIVLSIVTTLNIASCAEKPEKKEVIEKYLVTNPITMDTAFEKQYVAQIRSVRNIEIRSQEKGFLDHIYVDEGQYVRAGQVLFTIMPKVYEAEVQIQEAEAQAAEIEYKNAKTLADKNIVSKNEQSLAQAKLNQARAEVALARVHLGFTTIRAPFDGIIDRLPKKIGSVIEEGELLTTLSDNSSVFAYFNVTEPEYLAYQASSKDKSSNNVKLLLANGLPLKYPGRIELVEGEFNNETGNIAFRAKFPNNEKLLKNGETGKVIMRVPASGALIIPQKATFEIQDKKYVFVVDNKNKVASRLITVSGTLPNLYVINSGLQLNDKILLEGVQKVKDDDKIEYNYQKLEDVLPTLNLKAQ